MFAELAKQTFFQALFDVDYNKGISKNYRYEK
jgi:hypothetical protein